MKGVVGVLALLCICFFAVEAQYHWYYLYLPQDAGFVVPAEPFYGQYENEDYPEVPNFALGDGYPNYIEENFDPVRGIVSTQKVGGRSGSSGGMHRGGLGGAGGNGFGMTQTKNPGFAYGFPEGQFINPYIYREVIFDLNSGSMLLPSFALLVLFFLM